jgi:flagellar hook-basal body complex protein FliE
VLPSVGQLPPIKLDFSISQQLMNKKLEGSAGTQDTFLGMLSGGIDSVNQTQLHADEQVQALLTGQDVTQAEVLTAVQKADMSFRLLVQIRNKLMAAYEELNGIRV